MSHANSTTHQKLVKEKYEYGKTFLSKNDAEKNYGINPKMIEKGFERAEVTTQKSVLFRDRCEHL